MSELVETVPMATVCVTRSTPSSPKNLAATSPSATRAAVSLAEALSSTGRESSKPNFCIPVKSACPGLGLVKGSALAPASSEASTGSADIIFSHLGHSVF